MCYSEKASWLAFFIGLSGICAFSIARHRSKNIDTQTISQHSSLETGFISIGFMSVVLMQFYEAIMWRNQGLKHHQTGTTERIAMITNVSQPIVFGLLLITAILDKNKEKDKDESRTYPYLHFAGGLLILYIISSIYGITNQYSLIKPATKTDCNLRKDCRLDWSWAHGKNSLHTAHWFLYMITLVTMLLLIRDRMTRNIIIIFVLGTFVISDLFLGPPRGSKWCFLAISVPWVAFAITMYQRLSIK